jgi:hypothetical protein
LCDKTFGKRIVTSHSNSLPLVAGAFLAVIYGER